MRSFAVFFLGESFSGLVPSQGYDDDASRREE